MAIVWQANIVDVQGNIIPAANVEVRHQLSGVLATIYSDFALAVPISNPTVSDGLGYVRFFVADQGLYRIQASKGGFTRTWEYVSLLAIPTGTTTPTVVVDPAALAAGNNNDVNFFLDDTIGRVRILGDAGGSVLTGMQGGVDGRRIVLTNRGATTVTLRNQSALSGAANRFAMNGDMLLPTQASAQFLYDDLVDRWSRIG